jgi:hypothetical protein
MTLFFQFKIQTYFKLQMGFARRQYHYDSTTHKYRTQYTYHLHTNTQITQDNATKTKHTKQRKTTQLVIRDTRL